MLLSDERNIIYGLTFCQIQESQYWGWQGFSAASDMCLGNNYTVSPVVVCFFFLNSYECRDEEIFPTSQWSAGPSRMGECVEQSY